MRILVVSNAKLPVQKYGGTERVVWWLVKGLAELGMEVQLAAPVGTTCPFAQVVPLLPSQKGAVLPDFWQNADVVHVHYPLKPDEMYHGAVLATIHGNGKPDEVFHWSSVFVSRNHAQRHGADAWVYNGLDARDYDFPLVEPHRHRQLLFLAKASLKTKNLAGAQAIAQMAGMPLAVGGGRGLNWPGRQVRYYGMVGGARKLRLIAESGALLNPVRWDEPFGLSMFEAMLCGLPVLGTPYGSLPELVPSFAGVLSTDAAELVYAARHLDAWPADPIRDWALEYSHIRMAKDYIALYEQVLAGQPLNAAQPRAPVAGAVLKAQLAGV